MQQLLQSRQLLQEFFTFQIPGSAVALPIEGRKMEKCNECTKIRVNQAQIITYSSKLHKKYWIDNKLIEVQHCVQFR